MIPLLALLAAPAAHAADPEADYRGFVDQARFQIRKAFWDQAEEDLERAAAHPDGALDPEVWFLLAQVRLQQGLIPEARDAADRAVTMARDPDQEAQAAALQSLLQTRFGLVEIAGSQPGVRWRPRLALQGQLFDPSQQELVDRLERRLRRERPVLPVTIGLPQGTWTVNDATVDVAPDAPAAVRLTPVKAGGELAMARLAWLEVAGGVATGLGREPHLLPAPDVQLGLTVPIGGVWAVGAVAHWTPTLLLGDDGVYRTDPATATAGLRLGPLLDDGATFLVRPAVGYRAGSVGGFRLPCTTGGDTWSCGDGPADLVIYARGTAHVPFVELAVDYLDRRRTSGLGVGLKAVLERAIVVLPGQATADGPLAGTWTLDDGARVRGRTTLRTLATLSIAF